MSPSVMRSVTIDVATLRRLIAASYLAGCATWAAAEDDVRPWTAQIPSGQHRVDITAVVLAQIAEAARAVLDADAADDGQWPQQIREDLTEVSRLCR